MLPMKKNSQYLEVNCSKLLRPFAKKVFPRVSAVWLTDRTSDAFAFSENVLATPLRQIGPFRHTYI